MRLVLVALLSMSFAACGGDDDTPPTFDAPPTGGPDAAAGPDAMPGPVTVVDCAGVTPVETITTTGFAFTNGDVTIAPGDVIRFMPAGSHDMESDDMLFDSGVPGAEACLQFNEAGSYPYHCSVHPAMTGTVTVQ